MFEEADYIILQQVNSATEQGRKVVKVISADTDVFVLLCGMYIKKNFAGTEVYMDNFNPNKTLINIRRAVEKNIELVPSLIPLHSLTGCDTAPIRKAKALAVLKKHLLKFLGDSTADIGDVKIEGKSFISRCYGMKDTSS